MNTRSVLPVSKPMPVTEPTVRKNRTYEWWRRTQTRRLGCGTLARTGHRLRNTAVRDRGTNVTLAAVDDDGFRQRTFERGVESETRACGTGAVAIVACAKRLSRSNGEKVHVLPPGGSLGVTIPDDGPTLLSGPAVRSYGTTVKSPSK